MNGRSQVVGQVVLDFVGEIVLACLLTLRDKRYHDGAPKSKDVDASSFDVDFGASRHKDIEIVDEELEWINFTCCDIICNHLALIDSCYQIISMQVSSSLIVLVSFKQRSLLIFDDFVRLVVFNLTELVSQILIVKLVFIVLVVGVLPLTRLL